MEVPLFQYGRGQLRFILYDGGDSVTRNEPGYFPSWSIHFRHVGTKAYTFIWAWWENQVFGDIAVRVAVQDLCASRDR